MMKLKNLNKNIVLQMSEKRCIIESMKKEIKENPKTKKYLDKMVSDGIDEDTALNIMILAWQNHKRWNDE